MHGGRYILIPTLQAGEGVRAKSAKSAKVVCQKGVKRQVCLSDEHGRSVEWGRAGGGRDRVGIVYGKGRHAWKRWHAFSCHGEKKNI